MMLAEGLKDVTATHTAGRSQRTAPATITAVNTTPRERIGSVLRVTAQQAELQQRKDKDHGEEDPGHGGGEPELEEVLERRLEQVLDHGACGVARPALRQD